MEIVMATVSSGFVSRSGHQRDDESDNGEGSADVNDKVQLSLKSQLDDNDSNGDDGAELLSAAQECPGSDCVMSILHKNPALIQIKDPVGDTVLHVAARAGYLETVCNLIQFLDKQGDFDLKYKVLEDQNGDGDTILHLALKNGHPEIASRLVKVEEVSVWIPNNYGITPYKLAEEAGISELNKLVSKGVPNSGICDVDMWVMKNDLDTGVVEKDPVGVSVSVHWTKLYQAIKKGQECALIIGINKHGKELLMQEDPQKGTLLHAAVTASRMEPLTLLVEFMVSNGLTDAAFVRNIYGNTALHKAADEEQWSKAACLVNVAPETVYQVNHKGISPLYLAVKRGHQDIVKLMVSQSCLVGCASEILKHPNHSTLAHLAIKLRSFGTLQTLMEYLPNLINNKDGKGWRPLSYAAFKGHLDEVIYFLSNFPESAKKYDEDGSLPIHKAIGGGHVSIIQAFIKHCPKSLYHVTKKGQSVLHVTARYADRANKAGVLAYLTKEMKTDEALLSLRDHVGKTYMDYT